MSHAIQNPSEQHSPHISKVVGTIGALRFLWKQSSSLPRQLKKTRMQPVPQSVLDAYNTNKSVIEAIYGSDYVRRGLLYHGTGALQYDGDKYGTGMTSKLRRPIDAILSGGLSLHTDAWALTEGFSRSISFATAWSYAKFYADMYQTPDNPLEWEYGNGVDWFSYFIVGTARQTFKTAWVAASLRRELRTFRQQARERNVSGSGYNSLQRWALDVRSDITPQTSAVDVISGRTDIQGNFGAIITVLEDDVTLAPMGLGGTYEKRAARPVRPGKFISLAVPLSKVEEHVAKVQNLGYIFPVLPIEAVEYHMSHFPIQELAHDQRVV